MNWSTAPDAVASMLHAVDLLDWPAVRQSFGDRVTVDYSSLNGAPAADVEAEHLIAGWRAIFPGFDATQHLVGPIVTWRAGTATRVNTHVRAYHHIAGAEGGPLWMVAGHYSIELFERAGRWQIAALTLTVFYQEGNRSLSRVATARAISSPRAPTPIWGEQRQKD
jgi:hypothetical protein